MKRIISAWIEQFIEFDSEMEYAIFEQDLKNSNKKYRIISKDKLPDGKYRIHLKRQYNKNIFPEEGVTL